MHARAGLVCSSLLNCYRLYLVTKQGGAFDSCMLQFSVELKMCERVRAASCTHGENEKSLEIRVLLNLEIKTEKHFPFNRASCALFLFYKTHYTLT